MSYQVCLIYTLGISVLSFIIGNFFAILLAVMRMSQKPWLKYPARIYISFMRGVPMLVVLFILYFGLPYVGIQIPALLYAIIGFSTVSAAYMAEIFRSSISAVDKGCLLYTSIDTVTKNQPHKDDNLYQVATTRFSNDTSLYVIANESDLLNELMSSLQYSGLGGKRSSGFGRFELDIQNIPLELSDRLTKNHSDKVMSLTTCLLYTSRCV